MKKGICLLLCICMLFSCGITNVFAAKDATENILFSDDFESYKDGQAAIAKEEDMNAWSSITNAKTTKIAAYKDAAGMVMRFTNVGATGSNSPRIEKNLVLSELTNLTVSFRAKTIGASLSFVVILADGSNLLIKTGKDREWTNFKLVIDIEKSTYKTYENGELKEEGALKYTDFSDAKLRFTSGLTDGTEAYLDDVIISTTDDVTIKDVVENTIIITPEEAVKPFGKTQAPALSVPAGQYSVFTYDSSLNGKSYIPEGSGANFTKKVGGIALPGLLDNEKVIRFTNGSNVPKVGSLQKKISLGTKPTELTVAYYANLSKSGVGFSLYNSANKVFAETKTWIKSTGDLGWSLIEAKVNFSKKTMTTYCDGKKIEEVTFAENMGDIFDISVSLDARVAGRDTMLMDNVIIHMPSAPDYGDIKYFGETGTNWAKIGEPLTKDSYMANLRPHPRMFLNDRKTVLDKIADIEQCGAWYDIVKAHADWILTTPNQEYEFSNGRNLLTAARTIERRLMELGFVYLVEQDRKYIDRGLAEIRNAGTFPDWSNGAASMIPSELMYGIACFYDWAYNGLSEAERLEIIEIVKRQAIWQHVRAYDGAIKEADIAGGSTNRAMLANACAAGVALAFADEIPEVSEFLFKGALKYGRIPVEAFGTDGGFPEGPSYWGLASEFMVYFAAQCETAFVEGYEMPADLAWYYETPMIRYMGDYWLYTSGPEKMFNFGDGGEDLALDPSIYWLANKFERPDYTWMLNERIRRSGSDVDYPYFAILYYDADAQESMDGVALDKTFNAKDDAQAATFRSSWSDDNALYAAMQGGANNAGHMHNSLGTFVIDANGERFVRTIGRANYSALYSGYMYYVQRAEGQNTLVVNPGEGFEQPKDARASFVRHEEAENEAFSILDMTKSSLDFVSAKRGMYMTKDRQSVVLQDEVKMKKPSELWWFAHTDGDILLSADKKSALLTVGKERMYVAITQGPVDATFQIMQARPLPTSPVAPDEKYQDIYKLGIHMQNVTETTLAVEFVPLKAGEAAPESLTPVLPMDSWSVSDNTIPIQRQAGDAVALFLNSPVVLDKGNRTYVDTANADVYPFTENGRTLGPVRFIAESFDAKVGWDDATQTVTVDQGQTSIRLQIGSDKMYVNGEERILDVPANTYNARTLIPLRALVEALGKQVLWDDRGLIVISDTVMEYTETEKANIISLLSERVLLNGKEMTAFTTDKTDYYMIAEGNAPSVTLASGKAVAQNGNVATFTIGEKTYTITFVADKFEGQFGTNSTSNIGKLELSEARTVELPAEISRQPVEHVTFSTGHDKYVEFGTLDNIISNELVNRWSGSSPAWICYEFKEPVSLYAFGLAGLADSKGAPRSFVFDAEVSLDGETWEQVLDTKTSGTTTMPDIFMLNGKQVKYFRINGKGDSKGGTFNSYAEVCFYTSEAQMKADMVYWPEYFAGNTVSGMVGETKQLLLKAFNGKGVEVAVDGAVLTSADPGIATVDANGLVTFVGKGTTKITATYEGMFATIEASVDITVL